ncbi:hypothetical protein LDENG_00167250, partial [Lucifuga dentata]
MSISQTISANYPHWGSLQVLEGSQLADEDIGKAAKTKASPAPSVAMTTGLVYDERMMEHINMWD